VPRELRRAREKRIFQAVRDALPPTLIRNSDANILLRYARFFHLWLAASEQLYEVQDSTVYKVESKWGTYYRRHPSLKDMLDLHDKLKSIEEQVGLTPASRQSLISRLSTLPPGAMGDMFPVPETKPEQKKEPEMSAAPLTPLGFLSSVANTRPN
jgi:P27 family predicted phage terminase small subunit